MDFSLPMVRVAEGGLQVGGPRGRSLDRISDAELLAGVKYLVRCERASTACLLAYLGEVDARHLYLQEGCSSVFTFCTQVLHLSEQSTYHRVRCARAARRFPIILERLADGSLHLSGLTLLAPRLTPENHQSLLEAARHKTYRQVEHLVASIDPKPDVRSLIRKLPSVGNRTIGIMPEPLDHLPENRGVLTGEGDEPVTRRGQEIPEPPESQVAAQVVPAARVAPSQVVPVPADTVAQPARHRAVISPLAASRFKVQFTAGPGTVEKLRQARDLLRHQIPDGDLAVIIDRAMTLLLERIRRTRFAATARPRGETARRDQGQGILRGSGEGAEGRKHSRHIPSHVKRVVWTRDGGRCTFVSRSGRRCTETGRLEFHHLEPYALGGKATAGNIQLRCRAHNTYDAERCFGPRAPKRVRERAGTYEWQDGR